MKLAGRKMDPEWRGAFNDLFFIFHKNKNSKRHRRRLEVYFESLRPNLKRYLQLQSLAVESVKYLSKEQGDT